ncbi:hypothetical protein HPP92_000459 [Vanilla planifolia]|uniref:RNase III domain-containing protein n=1 Tax=Vanilla planifolia TaxID=51239 RepID=A0A835RWI4_VANPL|nr:hypothetical protein HPP92_000486 [Vanilla planifolia]KAG0500387.1 hypothetical protein HPP92_000459 [Vanilla planifolia]
MGAKKNQIELTEGHDGKGEKAPVPLQRKAEVEVRHVEEILDYCFGEKRLLEEALTHRSFYSPSKCGPGYKRLEFVGDSLLGCLMAREVFSSHADLPSG